MGLNYYYFFILWVLGIKTSCDVRQRIRVEFESTLSRSDCPCTM
uniref:Uncharacterized protein n=1 Tax=Rhizophora mucronata TaxID=61149 RepID=A0A2P2PFF8_RHIMU